MIFCRFFLYFLEILGIKPVKYILQSVFKQHRLDSSSITYACTSDDLQFGDQRVIVRASFFFWFEQNMPYSQCFFVCKSHSGDSVSSKIVKVVKKTLYLSSYMHKTQVHYNKININSNIQKNTTKNNTGKKQNQFIVVIDLLNKAKFFREYIWQHANYCNDSLNQTAFILDK